MNYVLVIHSQSGPQVLDIMRIGGIAKLIHKYSLSVDIAPWRVLLLYPGSAVNSRDPGKLFISTGYFGVGNHKHMIMFLVPAHGSNYLNSKIPSRTIR